MTNFTKKDPLKYPIIFGDVTREAFETKLPQLLHTSTTEDVVKKIQNTFYEWRYNLRETGKTEFARIELENRITTSIEILDGPPYKLYQLYVSIKPKFLGTLRMFNPDLMAEIDPD